jgi:tyrosyl-tRNA synthetase
MTFLSDLRWRGLIHQTTDDTGLDDWLAEKGRTVYAGFDPTADSLHVGSLLGLVMLRRFQRAGHKPIVVLGGATGMIGDPSGKSDERNLLGKEDLQRNVEALYRQMRAFLEFDPGVKGGSETAGSASTDLPIQPAELVNNFDWTGNWSYLEFLRDVGKNFPVNVMLAKDSVKSRLGRESAGQSGGMSYTEFSYMLLQAYDFVHLHDTFGCELQAGGSDQWGNITAGIDLARRMRAVQLRGLTWPLLTKADGSKMGKTESGSVWLAPERTSPYQFYQYWMNVDDAEVSGCLRKLTELAREEIERLDAVRQAEPGGRESQRRLAEEVTRLVHGEEGLAAAQRATEIFFGAEIKNLNDRQLGAIFTDVPSSRLERSRLAAAAGLGIIDALVESGLAKSKGEARRTIQQGGAYVNNRRIDQIDALLTPEHLASETVMVLRSGKKKYALLRFE